MLEQRCRKMSGYRVELMATSALSWSVAAEDGAGGRRRSGASVSTDVRASAVLISYGSWERQMPISRTCKTGQRRGHGARADAGRESVSWLVRPRFDRTLSPAYGTHVDEEAAQEVALGSARSVDDRQEVADERLDDLWLERERLLRLVQEAALLCLGRRQRLGQEAEGVRHRSCWVGRATSLGRRVGGRRELDEGEG